MLSAGNITLSLSGVSILHDVSVGLLPRQVTVILGPNGAGKTSLLRTLCGEQAPDSGEVLLHGRPLEQWSAAQRARVLGVLPQSSVLNFPFTVEEVVQLGRTPHSTGVARDREIVEAALQLVDGSYLVGRYYTQLSGGEKQRVQLARVLAQIWEPDPLGDRCLILDEPTSSFDLAHQQLMLDAVRRFADQGVSVCLVLHDLNLAAQCADQLILVRCGRQAAVGTAQQVLQPDILQEVFAVAVDVIPHPKNGRPLVIT